MSSDGVWGEHRFPRRTLPTPKKLSFEELKAKCLEEGILYEDPDFDDCDSPTISNVNCEHEWKRPQEILGDSEVPKFFVDGSSRFDIVQGEVGNCWLLAAIAALCEHKDLLKKVIPEGQDFEKGSYAGIFRFNFWWFGRWTEVIIDDRLPVCQGQLASVRSTAKNEFWSPLLEKAYAKLYDGYYHLEGGSENEAFEDLTGGIGEILKLRASNPDLNLDEFWTVLKKAYEKESLLGAGIVNHPRPKELLQKGLSNKHAYSVTSVREFKTKDDRVQKLVRIRNPWGSDIEWNGPWSDGSTEWKNIPDSEKEAIGLVKENDGEFWMSLDDFANNFHTVDVCSLGPDSGQLKSCKSKTRWEMVKHEGSWDRGVNAGGGPQCDTFWTNPQFQFEILLSGDDDDYSDTAIISLMQKEKRKEGKANRSIAFIVYKVDDGHKNKLLPKTFLANKEKIVYEPSELSSCRGVSARLKLSKGSYCVVPYCEVANRDANFLLRIYTERPATLKELDEETGIQEPRVKKEELEENLRKMKQKPDVEEEWFSEDLVREIFSKIAGEDEEIDFYELRNALNLIFAGVLKSEEGFSIETCKSIVASKDFDFSGKLDFEEFAVFLKELILWTLVFLIYEDEKEKGSISSYLLREMLRDIGITISNQTFSAIVQRYSHEDGKIHFDDFIHAATRLTTMLTIFEQNKEKDETATFEMEQFIQTTMYS